MLRTQIFCGNSSIWSSLSANCMTVQFVINKLSPVHNELARVSVSLNIPAFLGPKDYLTKAEVKASQTIASVCIHVERDIQRVKTYSIIRNEITIDTSQVNLFTNLAPLIDKSNKNES